MLVDGEREWVEWADIAFGDEDFPACGAAFEHARLEAVRGGTVGTGHSKLFFQCELADFAVEWFEANRV